MKEDDNQFIERRIITGLIVSTEYLTGIRKVWNPKLLGSKTAKMIAGWCIEFFDQYKTAPGKEIESIFLSKTKGFKQADIADVEDIIASLSDEYEHQDKFNVGYLVDQTTKYFDERDLREFIEDLTQNLDEGNILEAKKNAYSYKPSVDNKGTDLDLSEKDQLIAAVKQAFSEVSQPVVKYTRALGELFNNQLVRGGFVALMGPEKRGKTWFMIDMSIRAARQGANVAFIQAGDMSQSSQLMRIGINLAKKSDKEKYSGKMYEPVRDCVKNQLDTCDFKERECSFGVFENKDEKFLRYAVQHKDLLEALKDNPDYKPCHNCQKYWKNHWGTPWLKQVDVGSPLSAKEATSVLESFFVKHKRRFRLSVHTSGTLTVSEINSILDLWEKKDGFVPDLIVIDFADILAPESKLEFRHQENGKWMALRGLSQKRHALVVTATWTDANSYNKSLLGLENFSEDKRKYGHVTAMYGLNQDPGGREKEIGIMRINEIVVREDAFLNSTVVHVLQNISRGQPCLASYW